MTPILIPKDHKIFKAMPKFSWQKVVDMICIESGIAKKHVFSKSKFTPYAKTRHLIWYTLREAHDRGHGYYSYPQIGNYFNRDHSTIIHGVRKVKANIDPRLTARVDRIIKQAWLNEHAANENEVAA